MKPRFKKGQHVWHGNKRGVIQWMKRYAPESIEYAVQFESKLAMMHQTELSADIPILFNTEMVEAILDGRKTQTRRPIERIARRGKATEFQPTDTPGYDFCFRDIEMRWHDVKKGDLLSRCPFGQLGDRLWVREAFSAAFMRYLPNPNENHQIFFRADNDRPTWAEGPWIPSIHMPRWASRITLEINSVGVERVQDVSPEDIVAEGIVDPIGTFYGRITETYARERWQITWKEVYGQESWNSNQWVWVVKFKVLEIGK